MRIVSWNMAGRHGAWRHLLDELRPDVALVQEAPLPPSIADELGDRLVWQAVSNVKWGTAIVAPIALTQVDVKLSVDWMDYARIAAADVAFDGLTTRFVSVHPHHDHFDSELLAERPDLRPKLEQASYVWSCDVAYVVARQLVADSDAFVVGGDWNTARLFDTTSSYLDPGSGEAFFARAKADRWHDCYFERHNREGRTWFRTGNHGYQLDHVFVDPTTGARVRDCWIDERAAADGLSDHAPIVVELD